MPERAALYRRYRSQRFSEVVGQDHVTRTLRNAIASGQVAHAYLLAGARGIGKTSIARIIAKAVNCPNAKDGEACDTCESCVAIREGRFLDLIEIDAASNRGIDEMRDLREKVRFAPSQGQYKVYVIDEAHQLTNEAFNALLKTLEEPPPHVIFVLATTESQRIPATIVSRTQRFDLRRIPHKAIVQQLGAIAKSEGMHVDAGALEAIARHAQGSLRDAESILDQVATFAEGKIGVDDVDALLGSADWEETSALFDAVAANDAAAAVELVRRLVDDGRDLRLFVRRAIDHMRALVLVRASDRTPDTASEAVVAVFRRQAPLFSLERLAKIAHRLIETEQQLRTGEGTPLPPELALLDLTTAASAAPAPKPATPAPAPSRQPSAARSAPSSSSRPAPSSASRPAPTAGPRDEGLVDLAERRAQHAARTSEATDGAAETMRPPPTDLVIDQVRVAWSEFLERTKERSLGKAAQLVTAEPVAVEGSTVVIGFADEFARSVWQDKQRPELERQLGEILGATVRVRCVKHGAGPVAPATEDPMLRAALETFRRPDRILEVE